MAEMAIEYTSLLGLSQFKCHFKIYFEDFDVDLQSRLSCRTLEIKEN